MRKKSLKFLVFLFLLASLSSFPDAWVFAQKPPAEGEIFPELTLPLPNKVGEREYLMVEEGPFRISQIKADVLIVEVFSMYCPYCQREASNTNALFQSLSSNPQLKARVKLIGIGAGNSAYEVNAFRTLYNIGFPLLPDPELAIHKKLGEVRTPYFFVLRNKPDGSLQVVYSRVGSFGDPKVFLDMIKTKTGIGQDKKSPSKGERQ